MHLPVYCICTRVSPSCWVSASSQAVCRSRVSSLSVSNFVTHQMKNLHRFRFECLPLSQPHFTCSFCNRRVGIHAPVRLLFLIRTQLSGKYFGNVNARLANPRLARPGAMRCERQRTAEQINNIPLHSRTKARVEHVIAVSYALYNSTRAPHMYVWISSAGNQIRCPAEISRYLPVHR